MLRVILLQKSYNPGYTYLRNGKIVRVEAFSDRRVKRATANSKRDDRTGDLFGDAEPTIDKPLKELIDDHEKVIDALESPSKAARQAAADEQKEHLEAYREQLDMAASLTEEAPQKIVPVEQMNSVELPPGKFSNETVVIRKKGRKWLEVTRPGKSFVMKMEINEVSADFEVGKTYTIPAHVETESGRYGTTVTIHPLNKAQADAASLSAIKPEILRWLGFVEEKVADGYVYQKGVDKLNELGIKRFPELKSRLDAAVNKARRIDADRRAERQKQYDAERRQRAENKVETRSKRMLFPLSSPPPVNTPTRAFGRAVVFTGGGTPFRIGEDAPSMNGPHLLGHEGERGAYFYFRDAAPEETEALGAKEVRERQEAEARDARKQAIAALRAHIQSAGVRPGGVHSPQGRRALDAQDAYGGGDWFVIGDDAIWYVRNNGSDGSAWEANNVVTGGAGAIGWRVPFSQAVADAIDALEYSAAAKPLTKALPRVLSVRQVARMS